MLDHVVILRPAGNDTALVFDDIPKSRYKEINDFVLKNAPGVEQVMFVKQGGAIPSGQMAGGEFCGNATRSLGYYLLGGKDGSVTLEISGAPRPLEVHVRGGEARTSMPFRAEMESVREIEPDLFLVQLDGIEHLVLEPNSAAGQDFAQAQSCDEEKQKAKTLLKRHNLMDLAASGVMALSEKDGTLSIKPYVYVKSIDTFFAETACGSGSLAVAMVLAKKSKGDIAALKIIQPSGMEIAVDVTLTQECFTSAFINGPISVLYDGKLEEKA